MGEVVDTPRCQDYRLFPLAGRRISHCDIAAITEMCHDLGGALARDAELSTNGRDSRARMIRAHAQYPAVGELAFAEPCRLHGAVQPKLVAQPSPPKGCAEAGGCRRSA